MSRLREKLSRVASLTRESETRIEARADALIDRHLKLATKESKAFEPHEKRIEEAEAGLDGVEEGLRQLSNSPLLDLKND